VLLVPLVLLGCQGWNYDAWVGPFYPHGTKPAAFLSAYARVFDTVEVDSTFYAIPASKVVRGWASRVPPGFTFALKLPQQITHECRLVACEDLVALFADRARELGPALGPILIQLGPDFTPAELSSLASFLPTLPRDIRFAIEFRHRDWATPAVMAMLAEHRVAFALTDARWIPRKTVMKLALEPTADFAYVRWMGPNRAITDFSHVQTDRTKELALWTEVLPQVAEKVRTVFGYANNHFEGHSPQTVRTIQEKIGVPVKELSSMLDQLTLI
jgi:uncharacterized protein YecE (DUF72 family)